MRAPTWPRFLTAVFITSEIRGVTSHRPLTGHPCSQFSNRWSQIKHWLGHFTTLQFKAEFWHLRNGARDLLRGACKRGLRVIVVSNVPWDIRPLFTQAGLRDHVHGFALSCEVGSEKPDKLIFEHAIDLAG